jgi:hypothetical protein
VDRTVVPGDGDDRLPRSTAIARAILEAAEAEDLVAIDRQWAFRAARRAARWLQRHPTYSTPLPGDDATLLTTNGEDAWLERRSADPWGGLPELIAREVYRAVDGASADWAEQTALNALAEIRAGYSYSTPHPTLRQFRVLVTQQRVVVVPTRGIAEALGPDAVAAVAQALRQAVPEATTDWTQLTAQRAVRMVTTTPDQQYEVGHPSRRGARLSVRLAGPDGQPAVLVLSGAARTVETFFNFDLDKTLLSL